MLFLGFKQKKNPKPMPSLSSRKKNPLHTKQKWKPKQIIQQQKETKF